MVDINNKLDKIVALVDEGSYFTINRARQYGKTTTLNELRKRLSSDCVCVSISFEGIGDTPFESPSAFCSTFLQLVHDRLMFSPEPESYADGWLNSEVTDFLSLGRHITKMCKGKKVVLLIDEIDRSSNNRVLIHFLGMLRDKYLLSQDGQDYTFQSVILAGVVDIKNMKLKMMNDGVYTASKTEGRLYNSPWNIAVDFNVDMSFSPEEISTMLADYEEDHHTGMDIPGIANEIYAYTSGYPFLVSRICQRIDSRSEKNWTVNCVQNAVKAILIEENTLFDDMSKNMENMTDLYDFMYDMLIVGERKHFTIDDPLVKEASMYGYIKRCDNGTLSAQSGYAVISNKIFEMRLSNYFISKDSNMSRVEYEVSNSLSKTLIKSGKFNMELCLRKFAEHYREIYTEKDMPFLERHGRLIFISYLRPLVNGEGFFHIESQFTDLRRMDIVVDFGNEQFIIELKRWKGEAAQEDAYGQLLDYMKSKQAQRGYLLTFDFRKGKKEEFSAQWINVDGREIYEVII
jgi:uncharacterized protein YfkK (UPF0435 family)